jgi:hypothetical protein
MNFITAKLSDLANIPTIILEKKMAETVNQEDKIKLQKAINLRTMRVLSNTKGMFGMRNY